MVLFQGLFGRARFRVGGLEEVDHVCVYVCVLWVEDTPKGDCSLQLYKLVVHKLTQEEL